MDSIYSKEISTNEIDLFNNELIALNSKLEEFGSKTGNMIKALDNININHGISYLDSKNLMLGLYMKRILNFCSDKIKGKFDEKNIKKLVNLKVTQEKMKIIDTKIESQLNKYQRIAQGEQEEATFKPNLANIVDDEDNIIEETDDKKKKFKSESTYKPGKLHIDFMESNEDTKKRKKNIEKAKESIRNSTYFKELNNELSERPEEIGDDFHETHEGKYMKEVDNYEREYMTNVFINKKTIKQLRKKDRKEDNIDNFAQEAKLLSSILDNDNNEKKNSRVKEDAMHNFKKKFFRQKEKDNKKFLNNKRKQ